MTWDEQAITSSVKDPRPDAEASADVLYYTLTN